MTSAVREVLVAVRSSPPANSGSSAEATASSSGLDAALATWQRAREAVIDTLDDLSDALAAARYPESNKAIVLVRAIQANLVERPQSRRKADEIDRYLSTDEIIGHAEGRNGFGIQVRIREPLLAALATLKPHLAD